MRVRMSVLLCRKGKKRPLEASNDLRGKNECVHDLNEVNLEGVYEVIFLAK